MDEERLGVDSDQQIFMKDYDIDINKHIQHELGGDDVDQQPYISFLDLQSEQSDSLWDKFNFDDVGTENFDFTAEWDIKPK